MRYIGQIAEVIEHGVYQDVPRGETVEVRRVDDGLVEAVVLRTLSVSEAVGSWRYISDAEFEHWKQFWSDQDGPGRKCERFDIEGGAVVVSRSSDGAVQVEFAPERNAGQLRIVVGRTIVYDADPAKRNHCFEAIRPYVEQVVDA